MKPERHSKALELVNELFDGQLSEAQAEELNELLRNSPEARDLYLEMSAVHVGLERSQGSGFEGIPSSLMPVKLPDQPEVSSVQIRRTGLSPRWIAANCAACIAVVVGMAAWITNASSPPATDQARATRSIATLILADDCEWASPTQFHEGERLAEQLLTLTRGKAAIRFDGGTEMLLSSPTSIELRTAESAWLTSGEVAVRGTEGFTLGTLACDLIDFGTEFVASVDNTGETELHVLSGQLAVTSSRYQRGDQLIKAGSSVNVELSQKKPQPIEGSSVRFQQLLEQSASKNPAAELQAHESFSYQHGDYLPGELADGIGWASGWRLRSKAEYAPLHELANPRLVDSNQELQISNGDLTSEFEGGEGSGFLSLPPGKHYRLRDLSMPIEMGVDGITYFSMQFRQKGLPLTADTTDNPTASSDVDSFRITFRSSSNYWNESLLFGLRENMRPIVHTSGSGLFDGMASVAVDATMLWTGKVIRHKAKEDEIYFRIFTSPGQLDVVEPSTWHISTRGVYMDQSFDVLVLTSIGSVNVEVDEIRIGSSWRSVAVW